MSENNFTNTVESLFKGMDAFITTKTVVGDACLLYTSPSPRDQRGSRMPSSA